MTITLHPHLQKFIDEEVKAGRFASMEEALAAGIARLMLDPEPDVLDQQDLADIRLSLEQMRQGGVVNGAQVHAELRRRRHLNK